MRWEYNKDNICSDFPVARLYDEKDRYVLNVMENRTSYFTQPVNSAIKSTSMTYSDARKLNTEDEENQETTDVLFASMKHACEYFETDYKSQLEKLKTELF